MHDHPLLQFIKSNMPVPGMVPAAVVDYFTEHELDKNQLFLTAGRVSNEYLVLTEGFMRAYTHDTEGNEVTTYFFPANRVVLEPSSFFLRIPSAENLQALTTCKGYTITYEKLNALFHGIQEFREFGRAILVKEFAAYKLRTLGMINQTAEQRYALLMQTHPEVFRYAPLKQIASYLGITDTSLSRIRKEFARKTAE